MAMIGVREARQMLKLQEAEYRRVWAEREALPYPQAMSYDFTVGLRLGRIDMLRECLQMPVFDTVADRLEQQALCDQAAKRELAREAARAFAPARAEAAE